MWLHYVFVRYDHSVFIKNQFLVYLYSHIPIFNGISQCNLTTADLFLVLAVNKISYDWCFCKCNIQKQLLVYTEFLLWFIWLISFYYSLCSVNDSLLYSVCTGLLCWVNTLGIVCLHKILSHSVSEVCSTIHKEEYWSTQLCCSWLGAFAHQEQLKKSNFLGWETLILCPP